MTDREHIIELALNIGLQSSEEHWGTVYRACSAQQLEAFYHAAREDLIAERDEANKLIEQLVEALEDCVSDSHAALEYMRDAYGERLLGEQYAQLAVCKKGDEALAAAKQWNDKLGEE